MIAIRLWCMHNACMATSITIRNVPDDTRDELAARAARSGRSLQEYLRGEMIELARTPDIDTLAARVEARKRTSGSTLSSEKIVELRDAARR
jgi:antitoxin FitA